jgi:hypothetical protein
MNETPFQRAIAARTPLEQDRIHDQLNRWSTAKTRAREVNRVVTNMLLDWHMPNAMAEQLVQLMLGLEPLEPEELNDKFSSICSNYRMMGDRYSDIDGGTALGRAKERDEYVAYLVDAHYEYFPSPVEAERFLFNLELDPTAHPSERRAVGLSPYGAWATWMDGANSVGDPFQFSPRLCAHHIRASLGFSPHPKNALPLLLFTYHLSGGVSLQRPTLADAGMHPEFQPSRNARQEYGLTLPAAEASCSHVECTPVACKEGIHLRIPLATLTSLRSAM